MAFPNFSLKDPSNAAFQHPSPTRLSPTRQPTTHLPSPSSFLTDHKELEPEPELESPTKISHWRIVRDPSLITSTIRNHRWSGNGTEESPYLLEPLPTDPRNPMAFPRITKWATTAISAFSTLAMAFSSSAYAGGIADIERLFHVPSQIAFLGVSLFVFGFAIGPLFWAPMSELYGRRIIFVVAYGAFVLFNIAAALSQSVEQLVIFRFFAGAFGSATLTNTGGMISDMFTAEERGLASSIFACAPFLGPVLGPISGGFLGATSGWHGIGTLISIISYALWQAYFLAVPETYSPVLLRARAAKLSRETGEVYVSKLDHLRGKQTFKKTIGIALSRPWALLFVEPIVFLLSIYMAIIFGTMYMMFAAYPIVFQQGYGFSPGVSGLAFLGIAIGMVFALVYMLFQNRKYVLIAKSSPGGKAPPEARLLPCMMGGIAAPVGLFIFAWTNSPTINPLVCISGTVPFGFGMVLIFLSIMNYLVDTYLIYAASVLAANAALRSLFGATFPLFTKYMYQRLGIHWASSVPAFLSLACAPLPFLFYRYGETIRARGKYVAEVKRVLAQMALSMKANAPPPEKEKLEDDFRPCYGRFCLGCSNNSLFECRNNRLSKSEQ